MKPPRLAVDFDGVIRGADDELIAGTRAGLRELHKRYTLILFTARHDLDWVRGWTHERHVGHYFVDFTNRKPDAVVYLDDRAVRFTDWEQALEVVRAAA